MQYVEKFLWWLNISLKITIAITFLTAINLRVCDVSGTGVDLGFTNGGDYDLSCEGVLCSQYEKHAGTSEV